MSKLIVVIPRDKDGNPKHGLIRQSPNNPEWGSVMVQSTTFTMSGSIVNDRVRAAYFNAPIASLEKMKAFGLREGADINDLLTEKQCIARKETTTAQHEKHLQKINPKTQEKVFVNGQPVFMQDYVAPEGTADELIKAEVAVAVASEASGEAGVF